MTEVRTVRHAAVSLALHEVHAGTGEPLLLLHALGSSSAEWDDVAGAWRGPVFALDFAGHGGSGWRPGAAYVPELFAADADAALSALGACRIAGAGIGAYVALLVAGARPDVVRAALLLPGAGLDGGGPLPDAAQVPAYRAAFDAMAEAAGAPGAAAASGYDPMVRCCEWDIRPPDYARAVAAGARQLILGEDGAPRPPWWKAVAETPGVARVSADRRAALASLARF
jgi:pimeloyl-ACP methyl ester carboxylesterase